MQLNAVIILKSTNEYYQKIISKSGCKMDLYLAMCAHVYVHPCADVCVCMYAYSCAYVCFADLCSSISEGLAFSSPVDRVKMVTECA